MRGEVKYIEALTDFGSNKRYMNTHKHTDRSAHKPLFWTHLSSSSVMVPLGSASTALPQNLSLG